MMFNFVYRMKLFFFLQSIINPPKEIPSEVRTGTAYHGKNRTAYCYHPDNYLVEKIKKELWFSKPITTHSRSADEETPLAQIPIL